MVDEEEYKGNPARHSTDLTDKDEGTEGNTRPGECGGVGILDSCCSCSVTVAGMRWFVDYTMGLTKEGKEEIVGPKKLFLVTEGKSDLWVNTLFHEWMEEDPRTRCNRDR